MTLGLQAVIILQMAMGQETTVGKPAFQNNKNVPWKIMQ